MDAALTARIRQLAQKNGVPANVAWALVRAESGGRHFTAPGQVLRSPAGALGYTQLMPATARGLGVDPNDPDQNLEGGMRYLGNAWRKYHGNVDLVLASYNAGGGAVAKYGGVPPYAETKTYIKRIKQYMRDFGGGGSVTPSAVPETQSTTTIPTPSLVDAQPVQSPVQPYMDEVAKLGGFKSFKLPDVPAPAAPDSGIQVMTPQETSSSPVAQVGGKVEATQWIGTPYSWGGGSPSGPGKGFGRGANTVGFDCSSLAQWQWAKRGVSIPRTTYEQVKAGRAIKLAQARPGDLVFFGSATAPHHVGIFLGGGKYLEAPRTGGKVQVSSLADRTPSAVRTYG